jgi:hydrogenase 3 maturation protease
VCGCVGVLVCFFNRPTVKIFVSSCLCGIYKMNWREELKEFIDNRTAIMGIGSTLKSDDGVGVFIAESLKNKGFRNVIVAGATPEHWLGFLTKQNFEKILIIDSVLYGGKEGEIKLFDIEGISEQFGLTHSSSLHLFADFLSQEGSVKEIKILAIIPENLDVGECLSPAVRRSAGEIISFFDNFK